MYISILIYLTSPYSPSYIINLCYAYNTFLRLSTELKNEQMKTGNREFFLKRSFTNLVREIFVPSPQTPAPSLCPWNEHMNERTNECHHPVSSFLDPPVTSHLMFSN